MNERKDAEMCIFVHYGNSTLTPQFPKNPFWPTKQFF